MAAWLNLSLYSRCSSLGLSLTNNSIVGPLLEDRLIKAPLKTHGLSRPSWAVYPVAGHSESLLFFYLVILWQGLNAARSESPVCVFICCKTGSGPLLFSPPSQKEADENCCLFTHLQDWFCSILRHNAGLSLHATLKPWLGGGQFLLPQRTNKGKWEFSKLQNWMRQRGFSAWGIQIGPIAVLQANFIL